MRLPFSDELMTEDLVDIPELISNMKNAGYKLSINKQCTDPRLTENSKRLSDEDLIHVSLYSLLVFTKQ